MNLDAWIPERIRQGAAYVPGEQRNTRDWIKLNTNEFPYPPSPAVTPAITEACQDLRYYPEPTGKGLREAIGRYYSVDPDWVVVFNGCDDALNCCIRGFLDPGEPAAYLNPSYSLYSTLFANHGVIGSPVDYPGDFTFPADALITNDSRFMILTLPNAPTGIVPRWEEVKPVLEAEKALVVIDETYADFSDWTALDAIENHPNLMVVRSFSKTFGLAGLRVGFAVAHPQLVQALHKIRDVYNLDRLAQAGASAALEDRAYYETKRQEILATRVAFSAFLTNELGWRTLPSSTNFVFTFPGKNGIEPSEQLAQGLYRFLVDQRILVRYFSNHSLVRSGIRISVGTPEQMEILKEKLTAWKKAKGPENASA
jgi:histidinol-phosphate aminotransferase